MGDDPTSFSADSVYSCKQVIKHILDWSGADFALVQLERKVTGRKPLPIRTKGEVKISDHLVTIGHASGLPTKISTRGKIREIYTDYITASIDTYGGNSGGAVFNDKTGEVEGILVRGEDDYVRVSKTKACLVSNVCKDNDCQGEDITRISAVIPFLP